MRRRDFQAHAYVGMRRVTRVLCKHIIIIESIDFQAAQ